MTDTNAGPENGHHVPGTADAYDPYDDAATDVLHTTRTSYDTIAADYTADFPDSLADRPVDRALLTGFADLVKERGDEPVADVGSGPGRVTARLHALGVPVFGVDLSPRMVALARRAHPGLRFHVGSMTSLGLPDRSLGGICALYSIIHLPDDHLSTACAEFHRVLVSGGHLLLAFQTGEEEERERRTERFGHEIVLDHYWRTPDTVADRLTKAGLELRATTVLAPDGPARRPRAFLLARRPSSSSRLGC